MHLFMHHYQHEPDFIEAQKCRDDDIICSSGIYEDYRELKRNFYKARDQVKNLQERLEMAEAKLASYASYYSKEPKAKRPQMETSVLRTTALETSRPPLSLPP